MSKTVDKNKVALFAPNLAGGGAERILSILAAGFAENKLLVDLLLAKSEGPYLKDVVGKVNVVDFGCKRVLLCLPKMVSYLRKERPAVLLSSQIHSSTIALWAVRIAGVNTKVVVRQPTMMRPAFGNSSFKYRFQRKLFLLSVKRWADRVVVTSQAMADELVAMTNMHSDKISIIYNPLPIEKIQEESKKPVQHPWFQEGKPPVILAVGRLVRVKDFQTLIKAFSVTRETNDARLMILGEGPLRPELEQLVAELNLGEFVEMPGFALNPFQFMRRSKVFVLSSLWEGFPNGMIEAMACGANIVATNCEGGTAEILEGGRWGELVPVRNHEEMAKAINKALYGKSKLTLESVCRFSGDEVVANFVELIS